MAPSFIFKRGTTFFLVVQAQDDTSGDPLDLTDDTVTSELRDSLGNLVATLSAAPIAKRPGCVQLSFLGDTSAWPLSMLSCDVKVANEAGNIWATDTFTVQVVQQVTQ